MLTLPPFPTAIYIYKHFSLFFCIRLLHFDFYVSLYFFFVLFVDTILLAPSIWIEIHAKKKHADFLLSIVLTLLRVQFNWFYSCISEWFFFFHSISGCFQTKILLLFANKLPQLNWNLFSEFLKFQKWQKTKTHNACLKKKSENIISIRECANYFFNYGNL